MDGTGLLDSIVCGGQDFETLTSEILERGYTLRFRAPGGSMCPLIQHQDVLTVQPIRFTTICVGDVVLYRSGLGKLVAHRVVAAKSDTSELVVRGDALLCSELIRVDQVVGKVISVERDGVRWGLDGAGYRLAAKVWLIFFPLGTYIYRFLGKHKRSVCQAFKPLVVLLGRFSPPARL